MDRENKMESEVTTETTIILKLDGIEASWLKRQVQNPKYLDPQAEGELEQRIRKSFWNALEPVKL